MWSRACDGDIPVYWYQWHDTWHGTWGTVTLPGWSPLQLLFYLVMTSRSPLCSPPPLIQFPSHLAWRGGSVSQNIEVSPVFYSVKTNQSRWHVTHVTPPWPSDESWHTGEPLMRCHNDTGARVIYRGLESAKLSRSWGLPSRTTQRHRHNQTHKNTSINFHSCNRVNFDSWPGRADGLNNIH